MVENSDLEEADMSDTDIALMAHLLRRAGFGATRDDLGLYLEKGYEATVEELLNPGERQSLPDDLIRRYHVDQSELRQVTSVAANWLYRMVTTEAPLEEKIALFWHGLFATGFSKVNQGKSLVSQLDMFRKYGLGPLPTLLVQLSKDPTMIYWLDNNDNHSGTINENYGRELLELFSMGIGNYTEQDVKECSRAFTGWTIQNADYMTLRSTKASIWPYSYIAWQFEYDADDHDGGEKTFLDERGVFNGEDIIDIIVRNPATARFISRRLYQFFVADELDEDGDRLIEALCESYFESGYEIRSVLRTLFNSGLFKSEKMRFARVKSPAELVVGTLRLAKEFDWPKLEVFEAARVTGYMGQELFNPPSVEGWHEGSEWIDSGALVERVNFASQYLGNIEEPGVRAIIDRLASMDGGVLSPEQVVDGCLDLLGPITVDKSTRQWLVSYVAQGGDVTLSGRIPGDESERRVGELLKLIASSREFQLA